MHRKSDNSDVHDWSEPVTVKYSPFDNKSRWKSKKMTFQKWCDLWFEIRRSLVTQESWRCVSKCIERVTTATYTFIRSCCGWFQKQGMLKFRALPEDKWCFPRKRTKMMEYQEIEDRWNSLRSRWEEFAQCFWLWTMTGWWVMVCSVYYSVVEFSHDDEGN